MRLQYFKPSEFREWLPSMSPRLLTLLDVMRHIMGLPFQISPHPKSLGRHLGPSAQSEHNLDYWGEVLAVDGFFIGVYTRAEAEAVVAHAEKLGFTGIGVYPEWTNAEGKRQVGFHLGVRPTRDMGDPAMWGWLGGKQISISAALEAIPE